MAPMITDSYLNYNDSDFGSSSQASKYFSNSSNKPPLPTIAFSMSEQQSSKYNSLNENSLSSFNLGIRRTYSEENIIEILRGNNYKLQYDLFEDLILQTQGNFEALINLKNLDEFYTTLGHLLINTISNEVQRNCLRFLQVYFKGIDKLKQRKRNDSKQNEKFKQIDSKLSAILLEYLIISSVSSKLQLKQISIDLIYTYMKLTDDLNSNCFNKFIKYGVENSDANVAKQFMDPVLCILLTDEFQASDFSQLIKSLVKQSLIPKHEASAVKCLNKIENVIKTDKFENCINKLPQSLKTSYFNRGGSDDFDTNSKSSFSNQDQANLKFNLIPVRILQKLSGEDELQRLDAINQLEKCVGSLDDVKTVYPYYQDFIVYMNNFVDDPNYEIRLGSLRILSVFIEKLGINVNQCYKAIGACARNVLSQTHQSKTIKQSLTSMILLVIENMTTPILILDSLLEKIKDRNAKAREEFLNIIIASVLRYPSEKYDSLRKIFFQIAPLLCDIKRNVRHAALECIAVIFNRLKQVDRNAGNLLEQLEHVPEFQSFENLQFIRDVIIYRLNRNKIASLNQDLTLDYGIKIPPSGHVFSNGFDLDIEWIISASSSSSASASNLSSARSQKSIFAEPTQNLPTPNSGSGLHRMTSLREPDRQISIGSFRRPSASKRIPWDEISEINSQNQAAAKSNRSREVAPLKAFPLGDEADLTGNTNNHLSTNNLTSNNSNSYNNLNNPTGNNTGYPSSSSYQDKYLKKLQTDQNQSKTDSHLDLNDITNTAKKLQNEKAFSLENLYNFDESINSENNVQKRKYAHLNLKNGIIPSKPIIPRRNSANKYDLENSNNSFLSTNRTNIDLDFDANSQFSGEDLNRLGTSERDSSSKNKFDTAPSIRNSARNRKKLDKIFSIGPNQTSTSTPPTPNTANLFENSNFNSSRSNSNGNRSNTNREENNLYLSKLKAEKNSNDLNTSAMYSPSNPESGVFSLSDYDHSENRFIKLQQTFSNNNNSDGKKPTSNQSNRDLNNSVNLNSDTKLALNNHNNITHLNDVNIIAPISLDVVATFPTKPVLLKSSSKSKLDVNGSSTKQQLQQQQSQSNSNNLEYSPLAGVSFKQAHASDVEIVGVKLGNQSNHDLTNAYPPSNSSSSQNVSLKKKNSLRNLNESNYFTNDNENTQNDILDIVGKGYYANNDSNYNQEGYESNIPNPEVLDRFSAIFIIPESFEAKNAGKNRGKKKVEKQKLARKELDSLNSTLGNISPPLPAQQQNTTNDYDSFNKPDKNFGLSISSYQNQPAVYSKPPVYNQYNQQFEPQSINPVEDYAENHSFNYNNFKSNQKSNNNDYMNSEYPDEQYEANSTTLPYLDKPKFQPTRATQTRMKAKQAAAAAALVQETSVVATPPQINLRNRPDTPKDENETDNVYGIVKEDFVKQPFKSPESAFKECMNYLSQDDWEKKCQAMNILRRLSVYHEDIVVNNIHAIVLALVQEVKNLRSQVSRFAILTFGDLFTNLKKYMDVDLDIAIKTILQKNSETNEFIRLDIEKCLEKMVNNVTTTKAIIALINGGASHRNPLIRRPTAQYVYKCCEIMGPGKILSGIKDVTERILITASQFVVDGPVDTRWYGRKIFHMLMSHDEFDRMLVKYLNEKSRKNIKEILDTIRVKGPGDVPTESARNSRKGVRNASDLMSRSAGANTSAANGLSNQRSDLYTSTAPSSSSSSATRPHHHPPLPPTLRLDAQSQEYLKSLQAQLRNPDFRERNDAIEKFQILCETETNIAVANIVQIFDKFIPCLTDSNSKVNYKALNTMYQITPILGDDLNPVISNVVPIIAQNLASKNSEITDMASNILDVFVEYLDGGSLIQPFTNIAQHGNVRVKPQIVAKLADLMPHVYSRKQKQIELHVLPTLWILLNSMKGNSGPSGPNSLNSSVTKLVQNLYEQMGENLVDRAANSSAVSSRNLDLLKDLIVNPLD